MKKEAKPRQKGPQLQALCMECGMCCNGVLFADVKLQRGDAASQLRSLGLPLVKKGGRTSRIARVAFPQPCAAYDGCRCAIYADRPRYCCEFDCALLKEVKAGRIKPEKALRVIRESRKRVSAVRHLLCVLGDTDEELPLKRRFERTTRRLLKAGLRGESAETYGKLTLAMQNLHLNLSEAFYPGNFDGKS